MDEMESSRGGANFIWRCKFCKRESSALIKGDPAPYIESSPPQRQRLLEIDCRGLEFIEFKPLVSIHCSFRRSPENFAINLRQGQWQAKGLESYTHFPEIDLGEGEWYDYDEKAGQEVSVKDMEWFIIRD
ncbi:MAG: hypothetical protein M1833_002129 [Piccolia ochrophora]|nr:MAG: hypothetical protein M1833_002129 [Piccolia ochrophora]